MGLIFLICENIYFRFIRIISNVSFTPLTFHNGIFKFEKRKPVRNYQQDFLLLGFYPSTANSEKPECVDCDLIMTNDYMKKSKLLAHQQVKHPSSVGKELSYFEKKLQLQQKHAPKPLDFLWKKAKDNNRKTLKVSYIVSEMIAKVEKPHMVAERLVKPAMLMCAKELLGEQAVNILQKIPCPMTQ